MKQRTHLTLLLTFNISLTFTRIVQGTSEKFEKDGMFADYLCDSADIDLGTARSVTLCAGHCVIIPSCKSFFYVKYNKWCKGVSTVLGSTDGCRKISSSVYFKSKDSTTTTSTTTTTTPTTSTTTTTTPTTSTTTTTTPTTSTTTTTTPTTSTTTTTTPTTSTTTTPTTSTTTTSTTTTTTTTPAPVVSYGTACMVDMDCTLASTYCLQGTCQCIAGYGYKSDSDSCVSDCPDYGSTYIRHPNMILDKDAIGEYFGVSVSQCKVICSSFVFCHGFNYCSSCDIQCRLIEGTPQNNPADYHPSSRDYYSRNCA